MRIAARWAAGSRDERQAAVVGHVEPLVRVGRPRVGALDAGDEVRAAPARPPPTGRRRRRRAATRRARGRPPAIASSGSNAPVFTLPACAQTIVGPSPRSSAASSAPARIRALPVGGHAHDGAAARGRAAAARRTPSRAPPRRRARAARGAPCRPSRLDVPAGAARARAWRAAASAGDVRHLARRSTKPTLARPPAARAGRAASRAATSSTSGGGGRHDVQPGVLVPGGGQPVRGERRRQRAAGHEAEVARPGGGDEPGLGRRGQRLEHLHSGRAGVRQREPQAVRVALGAHRALGQPGQVRAGQLACPVEQRVKASRATQPAR